eukprot:gnl/MRDRNA2_/MRDRNA2_152669_c0_seq1.p1 gnl/MRDRNA2_/MRDRNA2_152669_c0~~gnl/MRDRNA2_/MRDRNA2_152669_c0_seq1.p1  ORF type:complete len:107 (-),score=12.98 gnl/MRDRNA2_/MRDRNA2_152669_c0_seq1:192-512(-)
MYFGLRCSKGQAYMSLFNKSLTSFSCAKCRISSTSRSLQKKLQTVSEFSRGSRYAAAENLAELLCSSGEKIGEILDEAVGDIQRDRKILTALFTVLQRRQQFALAA